MSNTCKGDDLQTQVVLNFGILNMFPNLLNSPKKGIRKEACWALSNITAGNVQQIQSVIDAGLIPPVINLANNGDYDIRKEAIWCLCNATTAANLTQINYLISAGIITALCGNLSNDGDARLLVVVLEGIQSIIYSQIELEM
jgi:hypothetical protein